MQTLVANRTEHSTKSAGFAGVWAIHSGNKFAPLLQKGATDALKLTYDELVIERSMIDGVNAFKDLDDCLYPSLNS
ncbi:MAG: hypothetical protein OHK0038_18110 [Flammeovirgaceae bacterium]